jgi:hypothetical protein
LAAAHGEHPSLLYGSDRSLPATGKTARQWLRSLELPVEECETTGAAMRRIEFLDAEIAEVERLIPKQTLLSPEARHLLTVPRGERAPARRGSRGPGGGLTDFTRSWPNRLKASVYSARPPLTGNMSH